MCAARPFGSPSAHPRLALGASAAAPEEQTFYQKDCVGTLDFVSRFSRGEGHRWRFAMRKLALGVLLAAGVGFAAAPAHAQGFWFGIGPFGVGVGAAPYAYDAYWGAPYRSYGYYAEPAYVYEPGYAYAPYTTYSYVPEYSYAPDYTDSTTYSYTPAWGYRSYAYAPRTTRLYTTTR